MLYKVVITFDFVNKIISLIIQMNAVEQYFPVTCLCWSRWF